MLSFKSNSLDVPGLLFCSFFVFLFFVGIWIGIFGGGGDCLNWNKKQDGGHLLFLINWICSVASLGWRPKFVDGCGFVICRPALVLLI